MKPVDFRKTAVISVLIALSFVGTTFIRIPIPATTGYFNLGDMFVILAGLWLGPVPGLIVGLIGPTAADAIGFPQFILATAAVKGLEGLVAGAIAFSGKQQSLKICATASTGSSVILVVGYFVFEAIVYPALGKTISFFNVTDFGAAIAEIVPNIIQGVIGAVGGVSLWRLVSGVRN